jgi:hypothetical protein
MKTLLVIILIVASLAVVGQAFITRSVKSTEQYPYTVLQTFADFEIREYEEALFTSTELPGKSYRANSSTGFSILAGYIFGGNSTGEQIAMTSPVAVSLNENSTMLFMVPKGYDESNLPQPKDSRVEFVRVPKRIVAAIRFGGWADDKDIRTHADKLKKALEREGVAHNDSFSFFGYNPPYDMVDRRNEVVVELVGYRAK